MPPWLMGDVVDVRKVVSTWAEFNRAQTPRVCEEMLLSLLPHRIAELPSSQPKHTFPRRISPNIESQLRFLDLAPFEGRQHCGLDVWITVIVAPFFCLILNLPHSPSGLA
jgi:3'-5' exoribonuclease 1